MMQSKVIGFLTCFVRRSVAVRSEINPGNREIGKFDRIRLVAVESCNLHFMQQLYRIGAVMIFFMVHTVFSERFFLEYHQLTDQIPQGQF